MKVASYWQHNNMHIGKYGTIEGLQNRRTEVVQNGGMEWPFLASILKYFNFLCMLTEIY